MKKIVLPLFMAIMAVCLFSCSKESKIKGVVTDYMKGMMNSPESFEITSFKLIKDTVPLYLHDNIAFNLTHYNKKGGMYIPGSGLVNFNDPLSLIDVDDDPLLSLLGDESKIYEEAIRDLCKGAIKYIDYIALVEYKVENRRGRQVRDAAVVIVSDNSNPEVLGYFPVDTDLVKNVMLYRQMFFDGIHQNQFGKLDTSNLPEVDKFILD